MVEKYNPPQKYNPRGSYFLRHNKAILLVLQATFNSFICLEAPFRVIYVTLKLYKRIFKQKKLLLNSGHPDQRGDPMVLRAKFKKILTYQKNMFSARFRAWGMFWDILSRHQNFLIFYHH